MAITLISAAFVLAALAPARGAQLPPPVDAERLEDSSTPPSEVLGQDQQSEEGAEEKDKAGAAVGGGGVLSPPAEEQWDEPPAEFFPPPRNDVPRLEAASGRKLRFVIAIPYKSIHPILFNWSYKKVNGTIQRKQTANSVCQNGYCHVYEFLSDLEYNTLYEVNVRPLIQSESTFEHVKFENWYSNTPHAPYTVTVKGLTCERDVPPVKELLVHTSGSQWLAISWLPPKVACLTQLEYQVRVYHDFDYQKKLWSAGSFWSNATWATEGPVTPCVAWPERHCLLLTSEHDLRPKQEYTIEVQVIRKEDSEKSNVTKVQGKTESAAPGPPTALHYVHLQPTTLELRWRSPLQPGGRMSNAYVGIRAANGTSLQVLPQKVTLQPTYSQTVENLKPNTWYVLSVWFDSKDVDRIQGGRAAELKVWTPPLENSTASQKPCRLRNNSSASSLRSASGSLGTPAPKNEKSEGSGNTTWMWITACVFLLLLVAVALFVGHRWGSRKLWILAPHDDGRNGFLDDKCVPGARSGAGDQAALCASAGAQPSGTPPSCLLEYAEVDLASGRAWATAPRSRKGSLPDYEEIKDRNHYVEQPYAVAPGSPAAPQHFYAELKRPTEPPPIPKTNPPVYAQVDKKRGPSRVPTSPSQPHPPNGNRTTSNNTTND